MLPFYFVVIQISIDTIRHFIVVLKLTRLWCELLLLHLCIFLYWAKFAVFAMDKFTRGGTKNWTDLINRIENGE